jgi:hypothetical protein
MDPMRLRTLDEALLAVRRARPALVAARDGGRAAASALAHCAQSIELSLTGYPELKPWVFRALIGRFAFRSFKRRGYVKHDLDAKVPGADPIANGSVESAIARLEAAARAFARAQGELPPHFAYGALSRDDAELAHAMHIADHLGALTGP